MPMLMSNLTTFSFFFYNKKQELLDLNQRFAELKRDYYFKQGMNASLLFLTLFFQYFVLSLLKYLFIQYFFHFCFLHFNTSVCMFCSNRLVTLLKEKKFGEELSVSKLKKKKIKALFQKGAIKIKTF